MHTPKRSFLSYPLSSGIWLSSNLAFSISVVGLLLTLVGPRDAKAQQAAAVTASDGKTAGGPVETVVMEKFVVKGIRESLAEGALIEKNSDNLKSVITANDIGALPDKNLADALGRISGISLTGSQGEGRYVSIRGVEPGLNGVTMNGETVAASDDRGRSGRAPPLDVLSAASAAQLEVVKTVTPDMDGQSIGGTINIVTPSGFDSTDRKINGSIDGAVNDHYGKAKIYSGSLNFSQRLGDKWGLFLSANRSYRDYLTNSIKAQWSQTGPLNQFVPARITMHGQLGTRDRTGYTANLDFRPAPDVKFWLRSNYTDYRDQNINPEFRFDLVANSITNQTPTSGDARATLSHKTAQTDDDRKTKQLVLGGEVPIGSALKLDSSFNYAEATETAPLKTTYEFTNTPVLPVHYDTSRAYFPMYDFAGAQLNPAIWGIFRFRPDTSDVKETTRTARINLAWEGQVAGRHVQGKLGAKELDRKKYVYNNSYRYTYSPRPFLTFADNPGQGPLGIDYSSYKNFGPFLDGRYVFGPTLNVENAQAFFNATRPAFPGFVDHGNTTWAFQTAASFQNTVEDAYALREKIHAAYFMGTVDFTDKLKMVAGVRAEWTDGTIDANAAVSNGAVFLDIEPVHGAKKYTNVLPNIQFRYTPSKQLQFRGAVTSTLSRPNYRDMAPISTLRVDTAPNGQVTGTLTIGNPELNPYEAVNFDASVDYYLPRDGVFSIGVFHKQIKNAVYNASDVRHNVVFAGRTFNDLTRSTVMNADRGHISGLEVGFQQAFVFLPAPLDGLGLVANYMVASSAVKPQLRSDDVQFFGQPNYIGNVQLYYQKKALEVRVGYHSQGHALLYIGSVTATNGSASDTGPDHDVYHEKSAVVDLRASYRIGRNWRVYAEVTNLTNEPDRTYEGVSGRVADPANKGGLGNEGNLYYGVAYTAGVGWNF